MIIMILFLNIERNNIFSTAHRTNRTYCVKALDMRTSILSIKIKVFKYLNNIHCIIDIVLYWLINTNYCYFSFLTFIYKLISPFTYHIFVENFQTLLLGV
jgi:hypothetical protein